MRRDLASGFRSDESDAKDCLNHDLLDFPREPLLFLTQDDRKTAHVLALRIGGVHGARHAGGARQRRRAEAVGVVHRGSSGKSTACLSRRGHCHNTLVHGLPVRLAPTADSMHHQAIALHILLVEEGSLAPDPALRIKAANVLQVSRLPRRDQSATTACPPREVEVDLAIAAVAGFFDEGFVDALTVDHDVVAVLLHGRNGAPVPGALHETRCGDAALLEGSVELPAVLHLRKHAHIVQEHGTLTALPLRQIDESVL
mmetsp:Transcript_60966/g.174796  ORF Transcript_60966/g.174796 Transcript_60966/m.174796 type:complete len:257 (-) Transcript_60966:116-886(-)